MKNAEKNMQENNKYKRLQMAQNRTFKQKKMEQIQQQASMEKEGYTQEMIDQIIVNVIGYSQKNGDLLNKYNDEFYLSYFDRFKIDETIKKIPQPQKQLQTGQFVRLFLSVVAHKADQTLYLTMSLVKLYKKIKEEANNQKGVKFSDFTSFLCNKISEGDPDLIVPMKDIPMERMIPDASKVRDIDIHPPPILSKVQVQRPKITKDKNKKDKKLQQKKPVAKFIYSSSLNSIIILGRLSSFITLYDPKDLKIQHKIIPSTCKIMSKDVAILSIAFCQRDQRIGCIINNIGITFWEASDNFATEKLLGMNKADFDPKIFGDKIYYLNLFNQWVTTDKDTIYFWDLKQQTITKTIKKPQSTSINDICQINHIRSLLVSYNISTTQSSNLSNLKLKSQKFDQHEEKQLVLYQDGKQKSKFILGNPGCHTICYNNVTQLIVVLGYQSNISVYQIDAKTFDINLISQLQAHTSILTCISNIPDTPMIISGDDIGHVKLWQLNYMRCLQGIRIAKGLTELSCNGNMLMYADSRINTIPIDNNSFNSKLIKSQKDEENYGIYQFFRKDEEALWIITRKEARQFDIKTGRIKNILVICNNEEDISAAAQVFNGFLVGTSKGEMSKFAFDGEKKWKIVAHEGEINSIKVDLQNHLVITIGVDNNLFIWPQKSLSQQQGPRKKISFQHKDINLVEICPYANLVLITSTSDKKLTIWNYDSLKLAYVVTFTSAVTSFIIAADKNIMIVTTVNGDMYVFQYKRKQTKLKIKLVIKKNVNDVFEEKSQKRIQQQSLQEQQQQQQFNNISQTKTFINKLSYCEDINMVLASTPKGKIFCFSPTNFQINYNYKREYEPTSTLKRPMRESFQHQLLKNQYINLNVSETDSITQPFQMDVLWYNQVHKEAIYFMNLINLEKKYLCSLCIDGYFKLTELTEQQGVVACSHKMSFPLPVKWDIDVQNYSGLKNQIHQAIVVIDCIIKNYSYELTLKQQKSLNITPFMQKMITEFYEVKQPQKCAQLMNQEFTQADVKQIAGKQVTLKNLEAYKRLQMIKKHSEPNPTIKNVENSYHYQTSAMQKESIRNFLQPNYLPKLLNRNIIEIYDNKKQKGDDLVSRIEEVFSQRENKKTEKQNKYGSSVAKTQLSRQIEESTFRKNSSCLLDASNLSIVKDKSVKQILGEINSKLYLHKKSKFRLNQSHSTYCSN